MVDTIVVKMVDVVWKLVTTVVVISVVDWLLAGRVDEVLLVTLDTVVELVSTGGVAVVVVELAGGVAGGLVSTDEAEVLAVVVVLSDETGGVNGGSVGAVGVVVVLNLVEVVRVVEAVDRVVSEVVRVVVVLGGLQSNEMV